MSTPAEVDRLLAEWAGLPDLASLASASVTPLPGGTARRSFLVAADDLRAVLRLPRPGGPPLAVEAAAVRAATGVGAGPELLAESANGLLVRHQPGRALGPADLAHAEVRTRLCAALSRLHGAEAPAAEIDLAAWTSEYRRALAAAGIAGPPGYPDLLSELQPVARALAATAQPLVAAHGDAVPDNFIDDGDQVQVIDLEYAVRAEPWYDLATLLDAAEGHASDDLAADVVAAYCAASGIPGSKALTARVHAWRLLARAAWLPWAMLPSQQTAPTVARWMDWTALRDLVSRELPGLPERVAS